MLRHVTYLIVSRGFFSKASEV